MPPKDEPPAASHTLKGSTLVITNLTKLGGLVIALHESLVRANARDAVIVLAAVLVLGAQVVEDVLLRVIDRFFGRSS